MILDIIGKTRDELTSYQQALNQQNQIQDIHNTNNQLTDIQKTLRQPIYTFEALSSRLDAAELKSLGSQIQTIQYSLTNSRKEFVQNSVYKQSPYLGLTSKSIIAVSQALKQLWYSYAQKQLRSYGELAEIARALPKMQERMDEIDKLLLYLKHASGSLPDQKKWDEFHTRLTTLSKLLDSIEGLDADKRAFLNKIRNHQSTLADFTPELLSWCAEMGLKELLSVRFKNDAS